MHAKATQKQTNNNLLLLRAGGLPFARPGGDELPDRLVMLPWGTSETVSKGRVTVNETTAGLLPVNQDRSNRSRVAIDFSHNSVEGSEFYRGEPVALAGYADVEVIPGEGLVFTNIDWTDEGRRRAGDYRELSAAVLTNKSGEVVWCHSGAICRHGQVPGLSLHTLAAAQDSVLRCLALDADSPSPDNTMDYKQILTVILGLPEDADDEAITAAAESYAKKRETEAEELKTLSTGLADLRKTIDGLPAETNIVALAQRIETLEKSDETRERAAITAEAISQGKIIPLSADKLPLESFRAIVADLPADQVPVTQRTPEHIKTLASSGIGTGGDQVAEQVRRQMGISKDQWDKHNN